MSCTVISLPGLLFAAVMGASSGIIELANAVKDGLKTTKEGSLHISENAINNLSKQEFKTIILDKRTLLKTISEHGAENIKIDGNDIECDCEGFHIEFLSKDNRPYTMKISYTSPDNLNNIVQDIGSEYCVNAQEISYNKIKERLKMKNLKINEEQIEEDDTIVLTVNLD